MSDGTPGDGPATQPWPEHRRAQLENLLELVQDVQGILSTSAWHRDIQRCQQAADALLYSEFGFQESFMSWLHQQCVGGGK